jgi:hypothetical protein
MKIGLRYLVFGIVFLFFAYTLSPSDNSQNCRSYTLFRERGFEGVIADKFFDETQHSVPTVVLYSFRDDGQLKINLLNETSGLFEDLSKGDTVMKSQNSSSIFVRRNAEYEIERIAEFNCDMDKLKDEPLFLNLYKLFD